MNKATDMAATLKEMMDAFPVDTKSMEEAYKNSLALTEKLSHVAIEAAKVTPSKIKRIFSPPFVFML